MLLCAVADSSEISRIIAVATICLLNHEGHLALGYENALGSIRFGKETACGQVLNHWLDEWVVERLAAVGDPDLKAIIDALELLLRDGAEQLPCLESSDIPLLKLDHILMGGLLEVRL